MATKVLSYLEGSLYFEYVNFPEFQTTQEDAPKQLLNNLPGCCCFIDGTYLYGESSHFSALHQDMYCHYKNELQLTKFLVFCSPNGFLYGVYGSFSAMSDDKLFVSLLSDAKKIATGETTDCIPLGKRKALCLHQWISTLPEEWISTLPEEASFGLDAGFPSAETVVDVQVILPKKIRKEDSAFTPSDAIQTRKLTKWRGVVERGNRRLKVFRLLSLRFPNSSLINAELFFNVASILGNKFGAPLLKLASSEEKSFQRYFE